MIRSKVRPEVRSGTDFPDQTLHSPQVRDPPHRSSGDSVLGFSAAPGTVGDGHFDDFQSAGLEKCGEEAVEGAEWGEEFQSIPMKNFETASGIGGIIIQKPTAHAIGDFSRDDAGPRVLAMNPPPANRRARTPRGDQRVEVARVVLAVAIHQRDEIARDRDESGPECGALSPVGFMTQHTDILSRRKDGRCFIRTSIIHRQNFRAGELLADFVQQGRGVAFLVEKRENNREAGRPFRRR